MFGGLCCGYRVTCNVPSSSAAPPGKIFSIRISGWAREALPPEILIPRNEENTLRYMKVSVIKVFFGQKIR